MISLLVGQSLKVETLLEFVNVAKPVDRPRIIFVAFKRFFLAVGIDNLAQDVIKRNETDDAASYD